MSPRAVDQASEDRQVGASGARVQGKRAQAADHARLKHSTRLPARGEAAGPAGGAGHNQDVSPRDTARKSGQANVQRARLLTSLVEFNPNANDDFSGWERLNDDPTNPADCIVEPAGTLINGPLHNQIPDPATVGRGTDNETFWVPNFSRSLYQQLIYSRAGVQRKIRPDLNGGVDISGRTVRNYYDEVSKGRYQLEGTTSPWLTLPHSEGWYSADSCEAGEASDVGHRTTRSAPARPGRRRRRGGVPTSSGRPARWSARPPVASPSRRLTACACSTTRTEPENAGIGVIAHEYGHDLGLPDLYDSIGPGTDTDVGWWDLMSTGSHSGRLFQVLPTHMGGWSKYVLGWIEPEVLEYGSRRATLTLGQASRPPKATEIAVKVNMPAKRVQVGEPHSGELAWWTYNDQSYADLGLTRTIEVPTGSDVRFWSNDQNLWMVLGRVT